MTRLKPAFALVPRDVLIRPPVCSAHRPLIGKLTPFECALALGLLAEAHLQLDRNNKQAALAAGAKAIKIERRHADRFKRDWRKHKQRGHHAHDEDTAPLRQHCFPINADYEYETHKPMKREASLKEAGRYHYKLELQRLRSIAVAEVTVTLTRSRWLIVAGLSRTSRNHRALEHSLEALLKPLRIDTKSKEPLLQDCRKLRSAKLRLRVSGVWLQPGFGYVPLPLPLRSAPGLALLLFLSTINTGSHNRKAISRGALCKIIGIKRTKFWRRNLNNAINVVNKHLNRLWVSAEMDRRLNNHKMRQLPQSYEVVEQGNDLIKFVAVTRFYGDVFDADPRDFEDEDDGVAEIVRRKPRPAYIDFEKLDAERQRAERERERAMNEMLQEIREANEW
jgi:hypothetical protein